MRLHNCTRSRDEIDLYCTEPGDRATKRGKYEWKR